MKYLITLLSCVILTNASFAQDDKNPRRSSFKEINTLINGGTMHQEQLVTFDKSKVITAPKQEDLIKIYKVKTKTEISEEDDEMTITHYSTSGEISKVITSYSGITKETDYSYEYDSLGNVIIERATRKDDGSTVTKNFTYNKNKLITRKTTYSDGDISYTNTYYDAATNTYIEENSLGIDKFFLNELGLRVHFLSYYDNYKPIGSATSKYDEKGLKISEESSMMGLKMNDRFTYNEKGQLLKAFRTSMLVDATWEYTYDERGLETSYKNQNPTLNSSYRYEYEFY